MLSSRPSSERTWQGSDPRHGASGRDFHARQEVVEHLEVALRLLDELHVRAVLEHDPLRGGDAPVDDLSLSRRALVMAPGRDERRQADLAETPRDIPVLERAGD